MLRNILNNSHVIYFQYENKFLKAQKKLKLNHLRFAIQSTVSVTVSFEQSEKPLKDWPVANFQRVFVNFDRA